MRPLMMWATCVLGGRVGRSRVHVCVECTCSPFGRQAMIGIMVGVMPNACGARVKDDGPSFDGISIGADSFEEGGGGAGIFAGGVQTRSCKNILCVYSVFTIIVHPEPSEVGWHQVWVKGHHVGPWAGEVVQL